MHVRRHRLMSIDYMTALRCHGTTSLPESILGATRWAAAARRDRGIGYRPCRRMNWHKNRSRISYCCLLLAHCFVTSAISKGYGGSVWESNLRLSFRSPVFMRRCTPHAPSNQCVLVRFGVRPSTTLLLTGSPLAENRCSERADISGKPPPPRERRGGQPKAVMGIVMKIQLTTPFHS